MPGRKLANGLYAGYDWRKHQTTREDVKQWCIDGSNVGLRADHFPGIDIDCTDPQLAQIIEQVAVQHLGVAPARTGRAPKRLLMYRTDEPFGRLRLWFGQTPREHLVEILGAGQQFLVHGIHPTTQRPYTWDGDLTQRPAAGLPTITRDAAVAFVAALAETLEMLGVVHVEREGDGRGGTRTGRDQTTLLAPSFDAVREAVEKIPNTNTLFPGRDDYLRVGYAIRAAAGDEHEEDAYACFAEWAAKWEGNAKHPANDPAVVRADWRRMKGPYDVGYNFLAELARGHGYNDASLDFDATGTEPARPDDTAVVAAALYSDQWIADEVVTRRRGELRFVPQQGKWLVWDNARWRPDADLLAEDVIKRELRRVARDIEQRGVTPKEIKEMGELAVRICSATKIGAIRGVIQSDRAVAVSLDALDHDGWLLNTPAGIIDLRTGRAGPADPDALCTRSTSVPADFGGACPRWLAFLGEATGGDRELQTYLQRLAGYCLTGSTREQHLTFIHGDGGNGKGVFLGVLSGILGDYARVADMSTFTASTGDKHTTDLAMLVGARLVTSSETQAGKRWDEAKVKGITGGDPITARFMRQDNFTFLPQCKLVFVGNHKPEIRDVDAAMRRRMHLVPFTVTPAVVDRELGAKLREEWPAILAWMVQGCLDWQRNGLTPPPAVREATASYFAEEDSVGRWLQDCCEMGGGAAATTTTQELFESWREWANANGEFVGTVKRLASKLTSKKLPRWRDSKTRRMGFSGVRIVNRQDIGILT